MSGRADWVSAALVGAERAGDISAGGLSPTLAELAAALADRPVEERLLLLAGAAELHDAAGRLPGRADSVEWRLPAYRPEGERPACSPAAARFLERMLNQQDTALLPELLRLLDEAGRRAPDDLLPHVLEHGAKVPRLRPALLPIVGERGRWLGALNPAWRYAAVDLGDWRSLRAAWEADPAGRPALAEIVRRRDAATSRHLLESTWRTEGDVARRDLIRALEVELSLADEPFLERALDDRDAQVRRKAVDLLAAIPGSRLIARMTAQAGDILTLAGGELTPRFPAVSDSMVRDGVVRPTSSPQSASERSRLLVQTVGVIPPAHWEERFATAPDDIARAALAGKWPRTLLTALSTAALRGRDRRWAAALLEADSYGERAGLLLPLLSPVECFARLAPRLSAGDTEGVIVFLRRWPGPWDEPTGRALLDFFGHAAGQDPDTRTSPTLRYLARSFGHQCPPSLADHAAVIAANCPANKAWEACLHMLVTTLQSRQRIYAAINDGASPQAKGQSAKSADSSKRRE